MHEYLKSKNVTVKKVKQLEPVNSRHDTITDDPYLDRVKANAGDAGDDDDSDSDDGDFNAESSDDDELERDSDASVRSL